MHHFLATAHPAGLPTDWKPDLTPFACAILLLVAAWRARIRLRWWMVAAGAAAGVPVSALGAHFGPWAPVVIAAMLYCMLVPLRRALPRSDITD